MVYTIPQVSVTGLQNLLLVRYLERRSARCTETCPIAEPAYYAWGKTM